jgi:ribosomal protection tetracycline resistance protein
LQTLHTLNLGILAHVDAGKTSLTERLLFEAGAIGELGSVDAGTTQTDSMDVERRRGITVRTNVASFAVGDVQVNLIDTPGHSDFIAEVERSLAVLDAAVLVISAVEGVQPQTVVLWRALRRLAIPAVIFINKIDRVGAGPARVTAEIGRRLAPGTGTGPLGDRPSARLLPLTEVTGAGSPGAVATAAALTAEKVVDVLTMTDDRLLRAALDGRVTERMALRSVRSQVRSGGVVPVTAGSALTGAGVPELLASLPQILPWSRPVGGTASLSGVIFKVEHGERGTLAHCRMFSGELRVRDRAGDSRDVVTVLGTVDAPGLGPGERRSARRRGADPRARPAADRLLGRRGHPRPGHPPVPRSRPGIRGRPGRPGQARRAVHRPGGTGQRRPADQPAH